MRLPALYVRITGRYGNIRRRLEPTGLLLPSAACPQVAWLFRNMLQFRSVRPAMRRYRLGACTLGCIGVYCRGKPNKEKRHAHL